MTRCKLSYTEWMNKVLLYSKENCIQYPMINHNGKEYKRESVYIYVCMYTKKNIYILTKEYIYI